MADYRHDMRKKTGISMKIHMVNGLSESDEIRVHEVMILLSTNAEYLNLMCVMIHSIYLRQVVILMNMVRGIVLIHELLGNTEQYNV